MSAILRAGLRRAEQREDPALAALHQRLVAGVRGVVVEIGCGRGALLRHYPEAVTRLVAIEPDPELRTAAGEAAQRLGRPLELLDGRAESIPLPDATAEFVVCSEVLCSVESQARTAAEIRRLLRPGGELRVYEHVRSEHVLGHAAQRVVDACGWTRLLGGCHTSRDTARSLEQAGFRWLSLERVWYASTPLAAPAGPHILGAATLP